MNILEAKSLLLLVTRDRGKYLLSYELFKVKGKCTYQSNFHYYKYLEHAGKNHEKRPNLCIYAVPSIISSLKKHRHHRLCFEKPNPKRKWYRTDVVASASPKKCTTRTTPALTAASICIPSNTLKNPPLNALKNSLTELRRESHTHKVTHLLLFTKTPLHHLHPQASLPDPSSDPSPDTHPTSPHPSPSHSPHYSPYPDS